MKKAFTLIEVILVVVVLGIVAGIGINIIKFANDNERRVRTLNELEIKSQVAMDFIVKHLDNGVKNSFRLKKSPDSECVNSSTDCMFLYNTEDNFRDFKVLEWARVAIIDKRKGLWDGINETRSLLQAIKDLRANGESCYDGNHFICFALTEHKSGRKVLVNNDSLFKHLPVGSGYGIYFLGDNIANTTTFLEKDLYNFFKDNNKYSKIELKPNRNFTVSNVYVLVDNIEGLVYDDVNKILKFYSYAWKDRDENHFKLSGVKDKVTSVAYPLIDDVSSFSISNSAGVTRIKLCVERNDLPGSFVNTNTKIKVCKTGVII